MKLLLEQIKREYEVELVEADWRKTLGSAALSTALALGGPNVTQAHASSGHHGKRHHSVSNHKYDEQDIIKAIVGEASNQGYDGMYAIACALRNRSKDPYYKHNILKGVFGSKRTPDWYAGEMSSFSDAQSAYELAFKNGGQDVTNGATLWGNANDVQLFKQQSWFKNVHLTKQIGSHYFFANNRG